MPPLISEGAQLFLKLAGMELCEAWSKKHNLEFLEGSMHVTGLAKLVNADLSGGLLNNELEFSKTHCRVNSLLRGS